MSPIPSPTPLRRRLSRLLFSPAGLLFGFVLLLIATCPGARGDEAAGSARRTGFAAGTDLPTFDLTKPLAAPPAARPFARSTKFDRRATSATRPVRIEDRTGGSSDTFRHSRSVLPLLVDPVIDAAARGATTSLTPMSGPAVGIRPKLPAGN
jgi:hypothetical protein